MIKLTRTYTDFNGVERTEDTHFNLTKAELTEMELTTEGGLAEKIQTIVKANDITEIIKTFKELILTAYGIKSEDGKRFIKNDTVREEFSQTQIYSDLFMELATNETKAAEFVNGIMPGDIEKPKHPAVQ